MSSRFAEFLRIPVGIVEFGLTALDAGAKTIRDGLDAIAGPRTPLSSPHAPPVHGPQDLDTALADFANQMVRIGWVSLPEGVPLRQVAGDLLNSARRAFGYLDFKDPRTLASALELPFSATGIAAETLLRMMAVYSAVGPKKMPIFLIDAAEVYVETAVFIGLEYKELMARYQEHLEDKPEDARTRLELGRLFTKCGRYDDAVRELNLASNDAGMRGRAKHESALAHFRAARFTDAVSDGVAAMTADPANERARAAMWLASRSLGGYPAQVPEAFRMELKAGYEPARVTFENIATRIGMDKISAGRGTWSSITTTTACSTSRSPRPTPAVPSTAITATEPLPTSRFIRVSTSALMVSSLLRAITSMTVFRICSSRGWASITAIAPSITTTATAPSPT